MKIINFVMPLGVTALAAVVSSLSNAVAAEEEPLTSSISAARPGFSSPSTTLEAGHWQWEAGYQFTSNDDDGIDSDAHTLPLLFLRLGINDRTEVNLAWGGYTDVDSSGGDLDGASDASIGVSYQLRPDDAALAAAMFASLSLPIGSDDFSSDDPDPSIGLGWSYAASQGPGWFGTFVVSSVSDNDERATQFGASLGASYSLSDRIGTYVEYFGIYSDSAKSAHSINGGFSYLVNQDIQLDINAGGGLNDAADDFFIGGGIAWRY